MADKRRFSKRGYLSYFVKNAAGEYIYSGKLYTLEGKGYGAFTAFFSAFSVLSLLFSAASGVIPAPGMDNCFYVIIPFILEIAFTVSVIWAFVRFAANKKPLREYVYDAAVKSVPLRALSAALSALAGILGEAVFVILNGFGDKTAWAACFFALKAALAASTLILRRYIKSSVWSSSDT